MKQIRIFTEEFHDIIKQNLPAGNYDFDDLVAGLADAALQIKGRGNKLTIMAKLSDFLEENDHIHLDAFIRVCLEDVYA